MAKYRLGDIAPIQQGVVPNNDLYWLLNLDMVESSTGRVLDYLYVDDSKIGASTVAFDQSNVLYSKLRPYLNKVVLPDRAGYATSEMLPLKPDEKIIIREYLTYFLRSPHFLNYINEKTSGAKMPRANTSDLKAYEIDCPSVMEQQKIVSRFDSIRNIIQIRQQQIFAFDELIKARFVELFGDPITNTKHFETKVLRDVLVLKAGDFTAASDISDEQTETHKYPCYGGNGIRGYVEEYNQEGEYSLIGRQGALSGNVQFARGQFKNTEHALLVTPLIEMNSIWLNQLLINLDLKRYQTGAAQPGLSVKNLQEIQILTVSLEDQNAFADFVEQVDKSKVAVQKALDEVQLLFNSLMQQYFG